MSLISKDIFDAIEGALERRYNEELRDRFAMAALPIAESCFTPSQMAAQAYKIADAMLRERKPKEVASPPKEGVFR